MEGERISLRLEGDDLELIDEFIEGHPEISNRSQLARIALRAFIERDGGTRVTSAGKDQMVIRVPPTVRSLMERVMDDGYYNTIEEVAVECLRNQFVTEANLKMIRAENHEKERQIRANL